MIMTEMVHDARIIRIGGTTHPPKNVRQWLGDSIGRWEGDTLVVETTNFHPLQGFRGSSENLKVTERFTADRARHDRLQLHGRGSDDVHGAVHRRAAVQPRWTSRFYEYACHEGNYGLEHPERRARAGARGGKKKPRSSKDCGGKDEESTRASSSSVRRWPWRRRGAQAPHAVRRQARASGRPAQGRGRVPRTPDGKPDLQGNWTNATLTPLERPRRERGCHDRARRSRKAREGRCPTASSGWRSRATRIGRRRPRAATDRSAPRATSAATTTSGSTRATGSRSINGEPRSSLIVDPPDGKVPATDAGGAASAPPSACGAARPRRQYDHPEFRPLAERCLMSFGSNAGPPMLPNYFYNNNYTIVQTKDHVMILVEMVHDVRIIRIGDRRPRRGCPSTCARGWAIRSAGGKATRWSSRRRTSTRCRCSAAPPTTSRSSSASPAPTPTRFSTSSRSTTRRRSRALERGGSLRGRRRVNL